MNGGKEREVRMTKFEIVKIDSCRILYKTKNIDNQTIYYCLQDDFGKVNLYRCSRSPWFEPQVKATIKEGARVEFGVPTGETELEIKARRWIQGLDANSTEDKEIEINEVSDE